MSPAQLSAMKNLLAAFNADQGTVDRILTAAKAADRPTVKEAYLTTRKAAEILQCHPKSIFRYAARGCLNPLRRSAQCVRWRQSEVEALAAGNPIREAC